MDWGAYSDIEEEETEEEEIISSELEDLADLRGVRIGPITQRKTEIERRLGRLTEIKEITDTFQPPWRSREYADLIDPLYRDLSMRLHSLERYGEVRPEFDLRRIQRARFVAHRFGEAPPKEEIYSERLGRILRRGKLCPCPEGFFYRYLEGMWVRLAIEEEDPVIRFTNEKDGCTCFHPVDLRNFLVERGGEWVNPLTGTPFTKGERRRIRIVYDREAPGKPSAEIFRQQLAFLKAR